MELVKYNGYRHGGGNDNIPERDDAYADFELMTSCNKSEYNIPKPLKLMTMEVWKGY